MRKRSRTLSLFLASCLVIAALAGCRGGASAPALRWLSDFSGTGWDSFAAIEQAGADFWAAGFTESSDGAMTDLYQHGQSDALLVRINSKGERIWATAFGGSSNEVFHDLAVVGSTAIAAGETKSSDGDLQVISPQGGNDALLVSFDKNGTPVWVAVFGGSGEDTFESVAATSDGGTVAAGRSSSRDGHFSSLNTHGDYDAFLVKYNAKGTAQWAVAFGGSGWDEFTSVEQTRDGGYIAAGFTQSADGDLSGLADGASRDAVIVKFNSNGVVEWSRVFSGSQADQFVSVAVMRDGYAAAGVTQSSDGDMAGMSSAQEDAVVVKYDLTGAQQWVRSLSGTGNDRCTAMVVSGKDLLVAGYTASTDLSFADRESKGGYDGFVYRLDSHGEPLWYTSFGSSGWDRVTGICAVSSGFALSGYTDKADGDLASLNALGDTEAFLARFD